MVRQASRCTQKACRKGCRDIACFVGIVVGAILSFLGKAVGFVAEHTWALIVFAVGIIGLWLMQKVQRRYGEISLVFVCDGDKTYLPRPMP